MKAKRRRKVTADKIRRAQRSMTISEQENPSWEYQRDPRREPAQRKVTK